MEKQRDYGGSAFPNDGKWANDYPEGGMFLRDWFAGQALTGLVGGNWLQLVEHPPLSATELAESWAAASYKIADAMLAARAR